MKLAIFDIDGTVINSTKADDECFIQTFHDLHQIDLSGADWNNFNHVTDSGLTNQIFEESIGRLPNKNEIIKIQDHFYNLLYQRKTEFEEIPGISEFLSQLANTPNVTVAFATGGWRRTARLKLQSLIYKTQHLTLYTADDHFKRTEIIKLAMYSVSDNQRISNSSVTYFGDGLWDLAASNELQINFVGVDYNRTGKLAASGADTVIGDFLKADASLLIKNAG